MANPGFQIKEAFLLKFYSRTFRFGAFAERRFSEKELKYTKEFSNLRIRAKSAKNFKKTFRDLTSAFPISMPHRADNSIFPCAVLSNFKGRLMK